MTQIITQNHFIHMEQAVSIRSYKFQNDPLASLFSGARLDSISRTQFVQSHRSHLKLIHQEILRFKRASNTQELQ